MITFFIMLPLTGGETVTTTAEPFAHEEWLHQGIYFKYPQCLLCLVWRAYKRFPCSQVSEIFAPYYKYCAEQTACQQYCKDQDKDNQIFKAYLAWCETQRDCNRLRLIDILVRPMQRLTKYSLLLKAVLKKTDDIAVKKDLVEMVMNI